MVDDLPKGKILNGLAGIELVKHLRDCKSSNRR
jgi:hypothetical protein